MLHPEVVEYLQNVVHELIVRDPEVVITPASILSELNSNSSGLSQDRQSDNEVLWNVIKNLDTDEKIFGCYYILCNGISHARKNNTPINEEYERAAEILAGMIEEIMGERPFRC